MNTERSWQALLLQLKLDWEVLAMGINAQLCWSATELFVTSEATKLQWLQCLATSFKAWCGGLFVPQTFCRLNLILDEPSSSSSSGRTDQNRLCIMFSNLWVTNEIAAGLNSYNRHCGDEFTSVSASDFCLFLWCRAVLFELQPSLLMLGYACNVCYITLTIISLNLKR